MCGTNVSPFLPTQLFDRICMALGGRAAEAIVFRRISTG